MCGIGAVKVFNGNATEHALKIVRNQIDLGKDSTGIAWIEDKKIRIKKEVISPDKFQVEANSNVAIVHNRLASVGTVKLQNAHPFLACNEQFALVHNGTFREHTMIRLLLDGKHRFMGETDSETFMHMIEQLAPKTPLPQLLKMFEYQRLLLLFRNGDIWGKGDLVIVHDNGYYVANEEKAFRGIFSEDEKKDVYKTHSNTVFRIRGKVITFWGGYEYNKRTLELREKRVWKPASWWEPTWTWSKPSSAWSRPLGWNQVEGWDRTEEEREEEEWWKTW